MKFERTVGIFGGTFNPPHIGHWLAAGLVMENHGLDEVLWVPNSQSPLKQDQQIQNRSRYNQDRLTMLQALTRDEPKFWITGMEMRKSPPSYTIDTIRKLYKCYPNTRFRLIIGDDQYSQFNRWTNTDEIIEKAYPIVIPRVYDNPMDIMLEPEHIGRITFSDIPRTNISSTTIRYLVSRGRSIKFMVPESVRQIIYDRKLYQGV